MESADVQSLVKVHRCSSLGPGKNLLVMEMIGLSSASVSEMARETNLVAMGGSRPPAATAPAPAMRTAQAAQEITNA